MCVGFNYLEEYFKAHFLCSSSKKSIFWYLEAMSIAKEAFILLNGPKCHKCVAKSNCFFRYNIKTFMINNNLIIYIFLLQN